VKPYITVERIQRETALHYGIGLEKLLGDNPNRKCAHPRHVAMYLARRIQAYDRKRTLPELGKLFDRDHTTIIHGCKQVERRLREDPQTLKDVGAILNRLFS
jgi:chromosomal replication initiator protein